MIRPFGSEYSVPKKGYRMNEALRGEPRVWATSLQVSRAFPIYGQAFFQAAQSSSKRSATDHGNLAFIIATFRTQP